MLTEEWQVISLGELVTFQRGYDLPHRLRRSGPIPIITSSGRGDTHCESRVEGPGVVTGRYGTIGEVFFILENFWPLNTTLFVSNFHGNDPRFVYYLLQTIDFHSHSGKSGVPGVNRNDLHQIPVVRPPLQEQRSIADSLTEIDKLIGGLDQLIAKKRDIKRATMQQLLSGQRRLPGFSGRWEARPFPTVARLATGQVDPRIEPYRSMILVAPDHIESGSGRLLERRTASDQQAISGKYLFGSGDVIYSKIRPYLRKAFLSDFQGLCSADMYPLSASKDVSTQFLLAVLLGDHFSRFAEASSARSGIPKINRDELAEYVLALPPPLEQTAIAEVLSDMDAEIAALEKRRDKTRALKQAMMQELLTGRTRLV